ncbi:MAG TPA: hypothetical protein VLC09_16050, partial [Polyangiaceae bacterium]|nr:hypothetical protein [Polyangiaceae bacterium]
MRLYRGIHAGLCTGVGALLVTTGAFAQDPAPEAAPEPAPAPAPAPAAEATAAPAEGTPATTANEEKVTEAVEEEGEILPKGLSFMAFADAYATMQTAQVGSPSPYHRAYDSQSPGLTAANGFSLAFGGLDVSYDSKYFGVTTSLRFGPGVPQFY